MKVEIKGIPMRRVRLEPSGPSEPNRIRILISDISNGVSTEPDAIAIVDSLELKAAVDSLVKLCKKPK